MIETDTLSAGLPGDAPLDRLISADTRSAREEAFERALRPKRLAEYVGQQKIREQLDIFIEATKRRHIDNCTKCDPAYGAGVAKALGLNS